MLAPDPQHLAAGHQHLERRAAFQKPRHPGGGVGHLLEVVEHQEHVFVPQTLLQDLQRLATLAGQAERPHHRLEGAAGGALPRQIHEEDPVPVPAHLLGGHLK